MKTLLAFLASILGLLVVIALAWLAVALYIMILAARVNHDDFDVTED